jgi:hypothetical protein
LLPLELFTMIASFLRPDPLTRLASTCKAIRALLEPLLYSRYGSLDKSSQIKPVVID